MKRPIVTILILFLVALATAACGDGRAPEQRAAPDARPPGVLIVNYAIDSADTFHAVGADSLVVLDWLQAYADSTGVAFGTQHHPFGELVAQIGPRINGNGGYWLYTINGEMATKGVSDLRVSFRDTVTFTYK